MEQATKQKVQKVLRLSMIFMLISAAIVIFLGHALSSLHNETKELEAYLELAEDIKPNFEESLSLYTENTKNAIEYVHSLRPEDDDEYIEFISAVENIAQGMSLNMELQSIDASGYSVPSKSPSIDYMIRFYGAREDLTKFLEKLEGMDYFVHVISIDYESLSYSIDQEKESPNITIKIKLYVK